MTTRLAVLAAASLLVATPLTAAPGGIDPATLWGRICSFGGAPTQASARLFASTLPAANCSPSPTSYQSLPSVGTGGDVSVNLTIGADPGTDQLCFVANGLPQAPVLRVGVGHTLQIQVANSLTNTGTLNETNCPIDTYGGEGSCIQNLIFPSLPGADGTYYPLQANQAHTADGTANLHVHGLFVSPRPCSDEVLNSTIYPTNWQGPVVKPEGCQSAPDTLIYTYQLPANHPAGVFWYHTHRHGESEAETQMGLAGAIVVEDAGDAYRASIGVTDEVLLVTDVPRNLCPPDGGSGCDGAKPPPGRVPGRQALWSSPRRAPSPATSSTSPTLDPRIDQVDQAGECAAGAVNALGGIELWTLKLNGAPVPESYPNYPPDSELLSKTMAPGQRQIFRLVNASADSFLAPHLVLSQNGVLTDLPMEVFARDGVGMADAKGVRHFYVHNGAPLIVPPSGRLEFVVHAPPVGASLYLQDERVYPGCGGNAYPARRLLLITAAGTPVDPGAADDSDLLKNTPSLTPYLKTLGSTATVHRTFVFAEYSRGFTYGLTKWLGKTPNPYQYNPNATDFYITEVASDDGEVNPSLTALTPFTHHSPPNVVVHLHGQESVTEDWLVENSTLEIHAFHMHQVHFRDVTTPSTDPDKQPLLDVVTVPAAPLIGDAATGYPGAPGWVLLRMTFTKADIGEFVFHCHILEHEDNGMMGKIKVVAD